MLKNRIGYLETIIDIDIKRALEIIQTITIWNLCSTTLQIGNYIINKKINL
jgi:hypothetical protein